VMKALSPETSEIKKNACCSLYMVPFPCKK
jgi:hypothetical protein